VVKLAPGVSPSQVLITRPEEEVSESGTGQQPRSREMLIEEIASAIRDVDAVRDFRAFLVELEKLGVKPTPKPDQNRMALLWHEPDTEWEFSLGSVFTDGTVDFAWTLFRFEDKGLSDSAGREYVNVVARLVPTSVVREKRTTNKTGLYVYVGDRKINLSDLKPRYVEWLSAAADFISKTEKAVESKLSDGSA
jgi:hypothetical protein